MTTTTDTCNGNVTRMVTLNHVETDGYPGRLVTVDITRCTSCPGTAWVTDDDGTRWKFDIPVDFPSDDTAAYWAATNSFYAEPFDTPEPELEPEPPLTDDELEAMAEAAEADYLADVEADRAFAEMLERRAENGTWFGRDPDYAPF